MCSSSQIAAGETKNPRRNLPRAIRRVYIRILLFYILGTLVIGLLVPSTNKSLLLNSGTAASPFVIAIETAGIKSLPSVGTDTIRFVGDAHCGTDHQCLFIDFSMVSRIQ